MSVLFNGVFLFSTAFVLHVLLWRVRVPTRQTRALLLWFVGVLLGGSWLAWSGRLAWLGLSAWEGLADYVQVWLFYISALLAYTITYSAVAADSPSLVVILRIAEAGDAGLAREDLLAATSDRILVEPRLANLVTDRLVRLEAGRYCLLPKGVLMARLFRFYRTVLLRRGGKGG